MKTLRLKIKKTLGFTLLELLIVIAIIGILITIVLVSLSASRQKAQTAKRLEEMHQIQNALELYFSINGRYLWRYSGSVFLSPNIKGIMLTTRSPLYSGNVTFATDLNMLFIRDYFHLNTGGFCLKI